MIYTLKIENFKKTFDLNENFVDLKNNDAIHKYLLKFYRSYVISQKMQNAIKYYKKYTLTEKK